jgi:hypothetical protein
MEVSVFNLGEIRLVSVVANVLGDVFPELKQQQKRIRHVIEEEEKSFGRSLVKVRMDMCEEVLISCHFLVAIRVIFVLFCKELLKIRYLVCFCVKLVVSLTQLFLVNISKLVVPFSWMLLMLPQRCTKEALLQQMIVSNLLGSR